MRPFDLRINNIILINGKIEMVDNVSEFGLNGYGWSDTHYGVQSGGFEWMYEFKKDKVEGYPISEDKLECIGLMGHSTGWGNEKFTIQERDGNFFLPFNNRKIWVEYIHQVQNLYLDLVQVDLISDIYKILHELRNNVERS